MGKHFEADDIGERIIRPREVKELTGLSAATVYRLERLGDFPARRRIGPKCVGWLASEVKVWLQSREVVRGVVRGND